MKQILYIPFLLFAVLSFGQENVLSGKVIDKNSGESIYYTQKVNINTFAVKDLQIFIKKVS